MPENMDHSLSFDEVYEELLRGTEKADRSLDSAPPVGEHFFKIFVSDVNYIQTEGIGTVRTHESMAVYADDGLSSDEGEGDGVPFEDEDEDVNEQILAIPYSETPPNITPLATGMIRHAYSEGDALSSSPTVPDLRVESPATPTPVQSPGPGLPVHGRAESLPTPVASPKPSKKKFPRVFPRRVSMTPSSSLDSTIASTSGIQPSISDSSRPTTPGATTPKKKFGKPWKRKGRDYNFNAANDILGIVMLEIHGATDLPRLKNSKSSFSAEYLCCN